MPVDLQPRIDKQIVKLVRDQPINFFRHCPVTGAQPRLHVARMDQLKVAPVMAELKPYTKSKQTPIDTGQHYDFNMSDIFFQQQRSRRLTSTWASVRVATRVKPRKL